MSVLIAGNVRTALHSVFPNDVISHILTFVEDWRVVDAQFLRHDPERGVSMYKIEMQLKRT